jgi:uncharacterized sporulation protein YeaH/YhbH (DUF444 family)
MNDDDTARRPHVNGWYDLFSRGSRDWLRHSDKVREAVRQHLPNIVAGSDVISQGSGTVRVPVRMLEHYHFRLREQAESQGVGQGKVKPGDLLGQPNPGNGQGQKGPGGTERGGVDLLLEFKVDDIIDWLWEDLQLPNLQTRVGPTEESDWKREGLDRHGARSRLDRRRSMKESIKRRALGPGSPTFTNEDLRFRQLSRRRQPATRAVVFFLMDVSSSMTDRDRQLAKTFFFWVVAGLRREYRHLETVFVAHTTEAWEFNEEDFFKVNGAGGTVASAGLAKVREIIEVRYSPASTNIYLFYASDGDNAGGDEVPARSELEQLGQQASYMGYAEISASGGRSGSSGTWSLFEGIAASALPSGCFAIAGPDDIVGAVRHFFTAQAQGAEPAAAAPASVP